MTWQLLALSLAALAVTAHAQDAENETLVDILAALESIIPSIALGERRFSKEPCDDHSGRDTFDFIVVGAGPAGCAMANRLSEIPHWDVLLLEAGGDETYAMGIPYLSGRSDALDWNYTSAAQAHGGCPLGPDGHCPYPRGFVMGGTSTVNTMAFVRGNRRDFDNWAAMGNPGWDYEGVLPYFKKMEDVQIPDLEDSPYHGTNGAIKNSLVHETAFTNYSLEAARQLGILEVDYNGPEQVGISRVQSSTFEGSRWSANRGYINGLKRKNFFLRKNSFVTKLLIENGTAIGVEYIRDGQVQHAFARKEVILSAGAINSPKILMLSGVGPHDHLEELDIPVVQDLPVGRTLYDHTIFVGLIITLNTTIVPTRITTMTDLDTLVQYFVNHTGFLTTLFAVEVLSFFEIGEEAINASWANFELFVYSQPSIISPGRTRQLGIPDDFYQQFSVPLFDQPAIEPYVLTLRPKSKGTLTLQDKNIYSQPIIDPNFFSDEEDVNQTVEAIKYAIRLFTSGPFAEMGAQVYDTPIPRCAEIPFGTDEYWSCAVRWSSSTVYHPCATCKMGPREDNTTVVSPTLKVWGVEGVRVVDASIMPMIPAAHLLVSTYMIGEKGADLVKCDHLGGTHCSPVPEEG